MGANAKEKALIKEQYDAMSTSKKAEYIIQNYRLELILAAVALVIAVTTAFNLITHKDPVLYIGFTNITMGEDLEKQLTVDALEAIDKNPKKNEILVYKNLYLSKEPTEEDHEYAYASQMKIMASVAAGKLDVILMNKEAYDVLSEGNYLMHIKDVIPDMDPDLYNRITPYLVENDIVLESNAIDVQLNTQDELKIVTESVCNAIQADSFPLLQQAGFSDTIYIGFSANMDRIDTSFAYLKYLMQ